MSSDSSKCLEPVFDSLPAEPWAGATWIGDVDESQLAGTVVELRNGKRFDKARLLVWSGDQLRGAVEVDVTDGSIGGPEVDAAIAGLRQTGQPAGQPSDLPAVSVVLCTRDRPEHLVNALRSLSQLDYPNFEVVVVDNNPASGLTPPVVRLFEHVRLVRAQTPGLSVARNAGLRSAENEIVVFTDDDVVLDSRWLRNLVSGFSLSRGVACVCGIVPTGELVTPAQAYFDRRVAWARHFEPAVFSLSSPPSEDPLFPLQVAQFGTGANFAVRRDAILTLGGFDEGLGVGSPAGGGEDIDMFVRVLLAGHTLVRQPSAVAWHRHRTDPRELEKQIYDYGLGLGAWIFKLLLRRTTLWLVLRKSISGVRHLRRVTVVDDQNGIDDDDDLVCPELSRLELRGVRAGPAALLKSRMAGRKPQPLKA